MKIEILSHDSKACPRCGDKNPVAIITKYFDKYIEFMTCRKCEMPYSREIRPMEKVKL